MSAAPKLRARYARRWTLADSARVLFSLEATRSLGRSHVVRVGGVRWLAWDGLRPADDSAGQIAAGLAVIAEAGQLPAEISVTDAPGGRDYIWVGLPVPVPARRKRV